jgi:hypothetical protein
VVEKATAPLVMAAIIASKKKETARQLECISTFTSEDPEILEYLNGSHHKKYAKRWQKEHTDLSPCDFHDNFGWIGYVREKLKFEELHLDVEEIEMVLFDESGFDPIGEPFVPMRIIRGRLNKLRKPWKKHVPKKQSSLSP